MAKDSMDSMERKTYRRSPGRQYGYDYDPLHSRSGTSQSEAGSSRSGTMLVQRPDPRRTRRILRESIIASKRPNDEESDRAAYSTEEISHDTPGTASPPRGRETRRIHHTTRHIQQPYDDHEELIEQSSRHYPSRSTRVIREQPEHWPSTSELMDAEEELATYQAQQELDDYRQLRRSEESERAHRIPGRQPRSTTRVFAYPELDDPAPSAERSQRPHIEDEPSDEHPPLRRERSRRPYVEDELEEIAPEDDYDEGHIYEDHELPAGRLRKVKGRGGSVSRRGLFWGVAAVVVAGGAGVAAVELAPKASQVVGDTEHQIQAAFNQGVQHGIDTARKEWVTALDDLEGVTLQGAIDAAQLTRVAYDVFVSPVIQFGANLATDFLSAMLSAFKTARGVLAGVYQDNNTLIAIQKVLESWVAQVSKMPTQLTAITDTELDGAQSYLRSLQQKLATEKAKLNQTSTPTPTAKVTPTPTPKK